MQEQETKVTPISEAAPIPELSAKEKKKLDRDTAKLREQAAEYYGFFRMGGAINLVAYKSMSELETAAISLARTRIREEDAKFQMKCMMAVFNQAIDRMVGVGMAAPAPEPPKAEASPEERAVSSALDAVMPMTDANEVKA